MRAEIAKRIISWFEGKSQPPYTLQISPVNKACNLSCKYCWQRFEEDVSENRISEATYLRLIEQAAEIGVKRVSVIGGGEPLLSQEFTGIAKKIKEERLWSSLLTNGTLFDDELIRKLIDWNWDLISISLDSPRPDLQNELRGEGSYGEIIEAIKTFKRLKRKKKGDVVMTRKPYINLNPVLTKENYKQIPLFIKLADSLGVSRVYFQPLVTYNDQVERYEIPKKDYDSLRHYIELGKKIARKCGLPTNLEFFPDILAGGIKSKQESSNDQNVLDVTCYQPWYLMKVFPVEKTAGPCMDSLHHSEALDKGLKEIWYGDKANQLREKLKKGEIPQFCQDCCGANSINSQRLREAVANLFKD